MVELLDETGRYPYGDELQEALGALMAELGLGARELTVVLMDDAAIAERNTADRGVEGPTDVLSYPTAEPDDVGFPQVPSIGDVLISLDTAARQADEHGHGLREEVLVLAAHGLTHLRGLDHHDDREWRPFLAAQRRILELAGEGRA
jgi:probable rRNA maturation factor